MLIPTKHITIRQGLLFDFFVPLRLGGLILKTAQDLCMNTSMCGDWSNDRS